MTAFEVMVVILPCLTQAYADRLPSFMSWSRTLCQMAVVSWSAAVFCGALGAAGFGAVDVGGAGVSGARLGGMGAR